MVWQDAVSSDQSHHWEFGRSWMQSYISLLSVEHLTLPSLPLLLLQYVHNLIYRNRLMQTLSLTQFSNAPFIFVWAITHQINWSLDVVFIDLCSCFVAFLSRMNLLLDIDLLALDSALLTNIIGIEWLCLTFWQWGKENAINFIFLYISISLWPLHHYFETEHCNHVTAQKWNKPLRLTLIIFNCRATTKSMAIQ